jgi:hypothetical protein
MSDVVSNLLDLLSRFQSSIAFSLLGAISGLFFSIAIDVYRRRFQIRLRLMTDSNELVSDIKVLVDELAIEIVEDKELRLNEKINFEEAKSFIKRFKVVQDKLARIIVSLLIVRFLMPKAEREEISKLLPQVSYMSSQTGRIIAKLKTVTVER